MPLPRACQEDLHAGLGITDGEWRINLEYTRQALNQTGAREQTEFLARFEPYQQGPD
jgi:hypothetical protein